MNVLKHPLFWLMALATGLVWLIPSTNAALMRSAMDPMGYADASTHCTRHGYSLVYVASAEPETGIVAGVYECRDADGIPRIKIPASDF